MSLSSKVAILVLLFVVGVSSFILLRLNESGRIFSGATVLKIGKPAPDFGFADLDGKKVRLSDYRGKVVLVNIWATWCRPCVDEMPSLGRLYRKFKDKDFEVLAISIDAEGAKMVAPFVKEYKLTFPALIDPEGSIKESYGVTGVPESFIIDQQGILVKKVIGAADWSAPEVFRFIENLLRV